MGDGNWSVEEGAIVGKTQAAAKLYGLLLSDKVYRDFTVRLKFKSIKGNSGFYVRMVLEEPDRAHGLQIEVDPRNNTGGIYESYRRAWVSRPEPEKVADYYKLDDWNEMEIAAYGGDVTVKVNGRLAAEVKDDPSRPGGQLAMQMHAGNEMLVMFKDIEICAVPPTKPDVTGPTSPATIEVGAKRVLALTAAASRITGENLAYMPEWQAHGFWRAGEYADWEVNVPAAGPYDVFMEWSVADKSAGNPMAVIAGESRLERTVQSTGAWDVYRIKNIGQIELDEGKQTITLMAGDGFDGALMDLRELRLVPAKRPRQ